MAYGTNRGRRDLDKAANNSGYSNEKREIRGYAR